MRTPPKNSRRSKGSQPPIPTKQPQAHVVNGLEPGVFVRESEHPKRWGQLVGPGNQPGECLIQYSTGARMTAPEAELIIFTPTDEERAKIEKATSFFERAMARERGAG